MAITFLAKRSKNEKLLAYVTIVIIFFAVGDNFVYQAFVDKLQSLGQNIEINEKKIEKHTRMLALKEIVKNDYKKNTVNIKMVGSDQEEIARFLKTIEETSRETNVSLIDMKHRISKEGETSFYKEYFIDAEVEADVDKIANFMYDIQKSPQLLRIERFSLSTKGEGISNTIKGYFTISKIVIPD